MKTQSGVSGSTINLEPLRSRPPSVPRGTTRTKKNIFVAKRRLSINSNRHYTPKSLGQIHTSSSFDEKSNSQKVVKDPLVLLKKNNGCQTQ